MSSSGLFPSRPLWPLTPLALACLIVSGETLGADGRPSELPSQVITANPLGNESPATPSSVLEGDELTLRQKGSLGETLNGLPGVSSTYFGPGASRPVIRGMDGDRIRLLRNGSLVYTPEPRSFVYRPSIDVFFESVANYWRGDAVGVLLTGMGRDGAQGLKQMRERGFLTIAQDQASCAVYGMPKAAAAIDAAVQILSLEKIAPRLAEVFD